MSGTPDPTPTISGLYPSFLLCYLIECSVPRCRTIPGLPPTATSWQSRAGLLCSKGRESSPTGDKTLPRIARQQLQKMARNRPFYPRFPCFLVPSPNQKRFFSVFKVSLNIMSQSDLASADVEFRKSDKELHLSGAPDCPIEQPAVWSFSLRSIVHSSLIILILLFDQILGFPFALQAKSP